MKKPAIQKKTQRGLFRTLAAAAALAVGLASTVDAQTLEHRWSFNGANGVTTVNDSVGSNPASIIGSAYLDGVGDVVIPGGNNPTADYVSFGSGIMTNCTNMTIEVWAAETAVNGWAELFSFGNGTGNYVAFIPNYNNGGPDLDGAYRSNNNEYDAVASTNMESNGSYGAQQYLIMTYNAATDIGTVYQNGVQVAVVTGVGFTPASLGNTPNNWLGRDQWGDPNFYGSVTELRIWNSVIPQRQMAASTLLGPGTLVTNLTPASVSVTAGAGVVITGTEQATVTVTLPQTGSTNLPATSDATNWSSGNPSILTVNSSGFITGVGAGSTTVSATVGGVTATSGSITVTPQTLAHRYSFVSNANDSIGSANGTLVTGSGGSSATISNGLSLPGNTHGGFGYSGYLALPNALVQGDTSVTVECWVTQNQANTWAELWDFGSSGSVNFALIPSSPTPNMRVAFTPNGGENDIDAAALPSGSEQYLVTTYNNSTLQGNLYLNGNPDGSATLPNTSYSPGSYGGASGTTEDMLGNDVYGDNQFAGTIYELRIWNGAVSPLYVAVSAAAGSSVVVTNLTPTQVAVTVTNATMVGAQTQQAAVSANFAAASGVPVTSIATNWTSGNTNILTVSSTGLITAQSGGSTTVSATVGGVTGTSAPITVELTSPTITQQPSPASETLVVGSSITYTVGALGGELSYQWDLGGTPIPGATNATLTLSNLTVGQSGNYSVLVTNALGSTNSVTVSLTVDQAILEHRYSFVSDASDSVGHANGSLIAGNNPATITNGLFLPGTGTSGNPSGYVSLPGGLLDGDTSVTVECWVTQNQANTWAEIWSFGQAGGNVNFGLIPSTPTPNIKVAFTPNGGEKDIATSAALVSGSEQYLTVTYNNANLTGSLYTNGTLYASTVLPNTSYSPGSFTTPEDVVGLDPFGGDAQFNGTVYELRIWNGVVSPLYLAVSAVAGSTVVPTNLTPTSVSVTETNASLLVGETENAVVTANFAAASGVVVTGFATNWTSANTNVLTVDSNGLITAVSSGSTTISATLNGVTGTNASITVPTSAPVITAQPAASVSLLVGGTLNASVGVVGNTPLTYFWFFNSNPQPISISSAPTLTLPNIQTNNAGNYICIVSNQYGSTNSTALALTVIAPTSYQQSLLGLNPLAYWPLNETSGTIAYDMAGSYNGTYLGGYSLNQSGPTNSFFGSNSASVLFDGTSAYVDIPEGPFNINGALTIMAWVNLQGNPTHFTDVFGHGDDSWRLSVNQNNPPQPGAADGSAPDATDASGIALNAWHMFAYTYAGGLGNNVGVFYLDGAPVAYDSFTATPIGDNLDVWIGGAPDYGTGSANRLINAEIAHCAIFNQALTASQIQDIYNGAVQVSLTIKASGSNVTLTWPSGVLLQASTLNGPWTTNSMAVSPYTFPATNGSQFFRVLVSP